MCLYFLTYWIAKAPCQAQNCKIWLEQCYVAREVEIIKVVAYSQTSLEEKLQMKMVSIAIFTGNICIGHDVISIVFESYQFYLHQ